MSEDEEEKQDDRTYTSASIETVAEAVALFYWTLIKRGVDRETALRLTTTWIQSTFRSAI